MNYGERLSNSLVQQFYFRRVPNMPLKYPPKGRGKKKVDYETWSLGMWIATFVANKDTCMRWSRVARMHVISERLLDLIMGRVVSLSHMN